MSAPEYTPGPVPAEKFAEFVGHMDAYDDDDLPDGAWFAVLEDAAGRFMRANRIKGCRNDATHQWVRARATDDAAPAPTGKPLPQGVVAGEPVNEQGSYYAADGTFMNADGTRSIFCDVDQ